MSGHCLLLKRGVLETMQTRRKLRAEGLRPDRLSRRVRQAGFKLALAHDLYVHLEGTSQPVRRAGSSDLVASTKATSRLCKVSLTMIVRNEEDNLPDCLASAEGLFDEIVEVLDLKLDGVRVTMLQNASSQGDRAPDRAEALAFLDLAMQALARFQPRALLVAGGHPADLELMARARRRGVPVVAMPPGFAPDRRAFADAPAVLVPSEYARLYYAGRLRLEAVAIPSPVEPARVTAVDREPRYLTFIDPRPAKGVTGFARIAAELGARRPDIPILVVEGQAAAMGLAEFRLDLSDLTNLHRTAAPHDIREFYHVRKSIFVTTMIREAFGRSPADALAASIPVLASDRGALPETLGETGFLFTVPERYTAAGEAVPTPCEVAAWVATVERLWDDPTWETAQQSRAEEAARRYAPDAVADGHVAFLESLGRQGRCGREECLQSASKEDQFVDA